MTFIWMKNLYKYLSIYLFIQLHQVIEEPNMSREYEIYLRK